MTWVTAMPIESIPAGFELTRRGYVKTPSGIVIGGAYDIATRRNMSKDMGTESERLQRALVRPIPVGWPWWFRVWHWLAGPR